MKRQMSKVHTFTLALSLMGMSAARAQGDTAPPSGAGPAAPTHGGKGIEEVVVTAQRRSQTTQKTALTIQVVSPRALARAGITSPLQLTSVAPSVQVGNSGPATSVYVRGVGSYASTASQSPAVPFYTDGVYVARSQSVSSEFYDVDRLEIVEGPQGTLYGRNATGGAINILTANPTFDRVSGDVNAEFGNYSNENGDFAVNVPLSPTLAIRASAQVVDKGGYTSSGLGDDVHQSVRIKLLWKPTEDMSLLLNASYGHMGGLGPAEVALNSDVKGWYPWLDIADPRAQAYEIAHGLAPIPGFVRPDPISDARHNLNFYNFSAVYNWKLSDGLAFTLLPSYRRADMQYASLLGFLFENGYGLGSQPARPETSSATSIEARLSGETERLKWVAGLYFFNEDQFQQYTINAGFPEHLGVDSNYGTRSYAAFGQATYTIAPHVRLIGGLRYTSDERSLTDGTSYIISPNLFLGPVPPSGAACGLPAPTAAQCLVDQYQGKRTFDNVSWKGGFEADVLQNSLLYATASRGFKAGGFNTQSELGRAGQAIVFQPEVLTAYEAGLKNRFLDDTLQVNVSGFYWDYKNHQEPRVGFTNAGTINLIYYNAGSSTVYGGDINVTARPWEGGTLNASVEYAQSEYQNFDYQVPSSTFNPTTTGCRPSAASTPGYTTVNCSGFAALHTPKWSGTAGVTQTFNVGEGVLTANGFLTYATARYLAVDFTPLERAPGYITIDASLTYEPPSGRWSVTAFVRNLNNGRVYTEAVENALSSLVAADINAPRTFGGRLSYKF